MLASFFVSFRLLRSDMAPRHLRTRNSAIGRALAFVGLIILVACPSASAPKPTNIYGGFVPVTRVNFTDRTNISPEQRLRAEAINRSLPANPELAVAAPRYSLHALGAGPADFISALDCMTAAIYYEAGHEPILGRRAVAQVILNRVRHPAFPNTVCGVVFQGSERETGCQFTFTCDGSLLRAPSEKSWFEAHAIAAAALGGFVEPSVGHATHYHATYVLPYWAGNLTKLRTIGSHVFYQWKGGWSDPSAFTDRYASREVIPLKAVDALKERLLSSAPGDGNVSLTATATTAGPAGGGIDATVPAAREGSVSDDPRSRSAPRHSSLLNVESPRMIEREARLKDTPPPAFLADKGTMAE